MFKRACLYGWIVFGVLTCGFASESVLTTTGGNLVFADGRISNATNYYFPCALFRYSQFQRNAQDNVRAFLGFSEGTFGHFKDMMPVYFWNPDGKTPYPAAEDCWMNENPDGTVLANLRLPGFRTNVKGAECTFTCRFCYRPDSPDWLFLRMQYTGGFASLSFRFDSAWTEFVPPNISGAARFLYAGGQNYRINGQVPIPDFNDKQLESFALYSLNSPTLDKVMNVVLFRRPPSWRISLRGQPNGTMPFLFDLRAGNKPPADEKQELFLALGNLPSTDGRMKAEVFYREEQDKKIQAALDAIRWDEVVPRPEQQAALLESVNGYLQQLAPDAKSAGGISGEATGAEANSAKPAETYVGLCARRDELTRKMVEALREGKLEEYFDSRNQLEKFGKELAGLCIGKLLSGASSRVTF